MTLGMRICCSNHVPSVPPEMNAGPFIGFLIPCGLFNWHYRTKEARDASTLKPPGCAGLENSVRNN